MKQFAYLVWYFIVSISTGRRSDIRSHKICCYRRLWLLFWFDSILFSSCYGPYEKLTQDAFMLMLLVKVVNSWESGRADERTNGRLNKRHSGNKIQMKYFYIAHRLIACRCVCLLLLELVMIYFPIQWSHILSTLFIV